MKKNVYYTYFLYRTLHYTKYTVDDKKWKHSLPKNFEDSTFKFEILNGLSVYYFFINKKTKIVNIYLFLDYNNLQR